MKVAEVSLQLFATGTACWEAVNASVYLHSVKNLLQYFLCDEEKAQSALLNRWLNTTVVKDAF